MEVFLMARKGTKQRKYTQEFIDKVVREYQKEVQSGNFF